jgi:micrococcal nuclease
VYSYRADIVRVIDGDTVEADIDLGFKVSIRLKLRLYGIDAPEVRGEEKEGLSSKVALGEMIAACPPITVQTFKDITGKYGRYLAILLGVSEGGVVMNLNDQLVKGGWAKSYGEK